MFIRFFGFFTFLVVSSLSFLAIANQTPEVTVENQPPSSAATQPPSSAVTQPPQTNNRIPTSLPFSAVPPPAGPFFKPNFAATPQMLLQGTNILPLCNYVNPLLCINQWSYQAIPLSYQQPGVLPQYQNYLPIFVPNAFVEEDPAVSEDWEMFSLPLILDTEDRNYDRTFYRKKSDHDHVRVVQKDESGQKQVLDGRVKLVAEKDIENRDGKVVVTKPTEVLPATVKEVRPGCFVIDKTEANTEASFNYDCRDCLHQETDPVLSVLVTDPEFVRDLDEKYREVARSTAKKVAAQTDGSGDAITKICSPEQSLSTIIKNFHNTCPNIDFKNFFKKAYCNSCKKGIPPEIMMAMMSIESGGRCKAEGTIGRKGERSIGLFQIESNSHRCGTNIIGSLKNRECLRDPINNLNKGIEILFDHYSKVNPQPPDTSQCSSWNKLDTVQKDAWRKGVSAYNGGPGWVNRAKEAGRNAQTLTDTRYLVGKHKQTNSIYKDDTVDWEKLRAYYFLERLSPGNKVGSGRNDKLKQADGSILDLTVSNIAHTEAVLGRNVTTPTPGIVEIWAQYVTKNKPASCPQ